MASHFSLTQLVAVTALVLFASTAFAQVAPELPVEDQKLVQLARVAKAPAEHALVAKQYRLRAAALEAAAGEYEAAALRAAAAMPNPVASKLQAQLGRPGDKDKQRAEQARRAAQEARARALHHLSIAVEGFLGV